MGTSRTQRHYQTHLSRGAIMALAAGKMRQENTPPSTPTQAALAETAGLLTLMASFPPGGQVPAHTDRFLAEGERIARAYLDMPLED